MVTAALSKMANRDVRSVGVFLIEWHFLQHKVSQNLTENEAVRRYFWQCCIYMEVARYCVFRKILTQDKKIMH